MIPPRRPPTYYEVAEDVVRNFARSDSADSVATVVDRLRRAAAGSFKSMDRVRDEIRKKYTDAFRRVTRKQRKHRAIPRFTRASMTAEAQAELQKKIISSIELIKLNREVAVAKTTQRMVGWLSSVPPEGASDTKGVVKEVTKALRQLPYEERRVIIDQGHKLVASLEDVVNRGQGAIAAIWHSHAHQAGYDFRPEHAKRDGKIYILRGSWADKEGLVEATHGYSDEHEAPAEAINCRCYFQYLYNLQDLPKEMLTQKAIDLLASKSSSTNGASRAAA